MKDTSVFPDPVYKDTVLKPLFDGVKNHFADSMGQINRAHLVMLFETGILNADDAGAIAKVLMHIDTELDVDSIEYTGDFEDYFFMVEDQLRTLLGADLGGMLHTARSRNDMDHTVFKLQLLARTDKLLQAGNTLLYVMINKAKAEQCTPIVAYTHGQPAQPSTFGHYLGAAIEVLLNDLSRLSSSRKLLEQCPMGAAAITTSGFPIDRHRMAELLGFTAPKRNSYGCIASVDYITGLYSSIKLLFLHLGRVFQDMAFWSAFEVGQLYVPDSLVQISSIMPQKRNPVPIEHMRHLASVTVGRCDTIVNTMHNTPFTDMNDSEGEVQVAGYAAFDSASRVLSLFESFVGSVSINSERVSKNSDAACATITELADSLVRKESLSFRQAHEISADTAKAVLQENLSLGEGYKHFADSFRAHMNREPTMDEASFATCVSVESFINSRDRFGGPAISPMDDAIAVYLHEHQNLESVAKDRDRALTTARKELDSEFQKLAES